MCIIFLRAPKFPISGPVSGESHRGVYELNALQKARLRRALERGYFPAELPPTFSTETFADAVEQGLFPDLAKLVLHPLKARSETHTIPRVGGARRRLSIPNPLSYLGLTMVVVQGWESISAHLRKSRISVSRPVLNRRLGRFVIDKQNRAMNIPRRLAIRSRARYIVHTDISQFYPSIYTHSIPWAIHGKKYAKRYRRRDNIGNRLDRHSQALQDGQTSGLPIGPDASRIISECVLVGSDLLISKMKPKFKGFRYIDDYEVGCGSYAEAEDAVGCIQRSLHEFELEVNASKTAIGKLPDRIDPEWIFELRRFRFRPKARTQHRDIVDFFDTAFELLVKNSDQAILVYALKVLRNIEIDRSNWRDVQMLILQTALNHPYIIYYALVLIVEAHDDKQITDYDAISDTLNMIACRGAVAGYASEVAWALWGLMRLKLSVDAATAKVLGGMGDSIVALLALDAASRGLVQNSLDTSEWESHCNADELAGEKWLLAYEANVHGWLPTGKDYVKKSPYFAKMKQANISFYDSGRVAGVRLTGAQPLINYPRHVLNVP